MKPRILYAGLFHETHSFLEETTAWEEFEITRGEEIRRKLGDASPTDGFLEEASRAGFEVIPTIDARAMPSGPVQDAAFEQFWEELRGRAEPAMAQGIDALFLVLHGAMVTVSCDDVEGELLTRLRALPRAETLPIFGVLDLHANVTPQMCRLANGLVTYQENPHIDAKHSAQRATKLLARCLREGVRPRMVWARPPVLWAPPATGTSSDPMLSLKIYAQKVERLIPEIWACNIAAGFSFGDSSESGLTLSAITIGSAATARTQLETGAKLAWSLRGGGELEYPTPEKVLAGLDPARPGPVLLVEPSDNIGGGAPGDGTGVLRAFLTHHVKSGLVVINDPVAVATLSSCAVGQTLRLAIGGKGWRLDPGPVEADFTLVSRSDGGFELEDRQSHLASMAGTRIEMGPCAVIRTEGITVLLTSRKTPPFDLGQLRSQGIEPTRFALIGVKAAIAHRRAYDRIAKASHYVETAGPCSNRLGSLPWRHLQRPVWPLDPNTPFSVKFA